MGPHDLNLPGPWLCTVTWGVPSLQAQPPTMTSRVLFMAGSSSSWEGGAQTHRHGLQCFPKQRGDMETTMTEPVASAGAMALASADGSLRGAGSCLLCQEPNKPGMGVVR